MATVCLDIEDSTTAATLEAWLRADGHSIADAGAQVVITNDALAAISYAQDSPTLVTASAGQLRSAIAAMRQGVHGYIFVPLQPGEPEVMVRRAAGECPQAAGIRPRTLAQAEREHIEEVLRFCGGKRADAARILGIGRNTLWRKLKQYEE